LLFRSVKLENKKEYNIMLFNDWHLGSLVHDENLRNKALSHIDNNANHTRILLNGDLFHNITKHSKGALKDQNLSPEQQLDLAVQIFKPYRTLIDLCTLGNHDIRTENEADIDLMRVFCKMIDRPEIYAKHRGVVGYSLNKHFYSIELFHGVGGGGTIAAVERNLKRLKRTTSDIMATGHWHKEYAKPYKEYVVDARNHHVKEYKKWYICGNSLVNTESYAEQFGYEENFPSQAYIKLSGKHKQRGIEVEWIR
jgi:hypothetical protein